MQHSIGEIKIGPATPTPALSAKQISDDSTFNVLSSTLMESAIN